MHRSDNHVPSTSSRLKSCSSYTNLSHDVKIALIFMSDVCMATDRCVNLTALNVAV